MVKQPEATERSRCFVAVANPHLCPCSTMMKLVTAQQAKDHHLENRSKNTLWWGKGDLEGIERKKAREDKFFVCGGFGMPSDNPKVPRYLQTYPWVNRQGKCFMADKKALGDTAQRSCKYQFTKGLLQGKTTVFMTPARILINWHLNKYHEGKVGISRETTGEGEEQVERIKIEGNSYFDNDEFKPLDLPTNVSMRKRKEWHTISRGTTPPHRTRPHAPAPPPPHMGPVTCAANDGSPGAIGSWWGQLCVCCYYPDLESSRRGNACVAARNRQDC